MHTKFVQKNLTYVVANEKHSSKSTYLHYIGTKEKYRGFRRCIPSKKILVNCTDISQLIVCLITIRSCAWSEKNVNECKRHWGEDWFPKERKSINQKCSYNPEPERRERPLLWCTALTSLLIQRFYLKSCRVKLVLQGSRSSFYQPGWKFHVMFLCDDFAWFSSLHCPCLHSCANGQVGQGSCKFPLL